MPSRLFLGIVNQMKEVIDRTIGVVDEAFHIVACSDLTRMGENLETLTVDAFDNTESFVQGGYTYRVFGARPQGEYLAFVEGTDELAEKYTRLLAISLANVKQYYDEKYDRGNFVKNVIMDNILPGDIYLKARELHFNGDVSRVVLLVHIHNPSEVSAFDVIQNLFPETNKDFVINISETDIAVVKEMRTRVDSKDLE